MSRSLPEDFFDNAEFQKFFANVARDLELCPEVRNGSLTIYYQGAALIREVRVTEGRITGQVHYKYIPVNPPDKSSYFPLQFGTDGFSFPQNSAPLAIGFGTTEVLSEYKRTMRSVSHNLECLIVHEIVCHHQNLILDQEIKFQTSGETGGDKIDICHFDTHRNCLAFVEVKGIHDSRLEPGANEVPEVAEQLQRYCVRIESQRAEVLDDYQRVVNLKKRLGLSERLRGVPDSGPTSLLKKPVLVIGHCKGKDVQAILGRHEKWVPLLDGIRDWAAGLILCGSAGCRLNLEHGRQVLIFDPTVI